MIGRSGIDDELLLDLVQELLGVVTENLCLARKDLHIMNES